MGSRLDYEKAKRRDKTRSLADPRDSASYWEPRKKKRRRRKPQPVVVKSAGTGWCAACRAHFVPGDKMRRGKGGKWQHTDCPSGVVR